LDLADDDGFEFAAGGFEVEVCLGLLAFVMCEQV